MAKTGDKKFTEVGLEALRRRAEKSPLPAGERIFYADSGNGAVGGFKIRQTGAVLSYGLMARFDGKHPTFRVIGRVDGITLKEARSRARNWLALIAWGQDPAVIEKEERHAKEQAQEAEKQAAARARQAEEAAKKYTLSALIAHYVEHLETQGKPSSAEARNCLEKHILKARPELSSLPARDITRRQAAEVIRNVVEQGKGRMAGKVRSYAIAAYSLALGAEMDTSAPSALIPFNIQSNPFAGVKALTEHIRARERWLNQQELIAYWKRLNATEGLPADIAKVQLLTGGQRWEQLLRTLVSDYDPHARTLVLRDPKGKRKTPRIHLVPLVDDANIIIERLAKKARELELRWLFSFDGQMPVHPRSVSKVIEGIAQTMVMAGEADPFKPSDIRRSCETRFQEMGISTDVRAHIQSHGLFGIQHKHYGRHHYMDEKRAALEALVSFLKAEPAKNVVTLRTK